MWRAWALLWVGLAGTVIGPLAPPEGDAEGWRSEVARIRQSAPDTLDLAAALERYAAAAANDPDQALAALREAWSIRRRVGGEPTLQARTAESLLRLLRGQRRFAEAAAFAEEAVPVAQADGVRGTPAAASLLYLSGSSASLAGRYEDARNWLTAAESAASALAPEGSVALATVQRDLGVACHLQGRYADAEAAYARSASTAARAGASPGFAAGVLSNQGQLAKDLGRYDEAEDFQLRALALVTENDRNRPAIENNLATLYEAMGRGEEARRRFESAARGFAAMGAVQNAATALNNVALNQLTSGDAEAARRTFDEVERLYAVTLMAENPLWSTLELNQARAFAASGDLAEAERRVRSATGGLLRRLPPGHPDHADAWRLAGEVQHRQGRPSSAIPFYQRALAAERTSLPPDHPFIADTLARLGWADLGAARNPLAHFERSARARVRHIERTAVGLSPDSAAARSATDRTILEASVAVARRLPRSHAAAYGWVLNLRGRALSAQLALRRNLAAAGSDPEIAQLMMEARSARDASVGDGDGAQAARRRADELEGVLNRRLAQVARPSSQGWVDGIALSRRLGRRVLVEFLRVRDIDPAILDARSERYGAFVMGGGQTRYVDLGDAAEIELLVRRYRLTVQLMDDDEELAAQLYQRLIAPLALPGSLRDVVIAPDSALHFLPFEALVPGPDRRWVDLVAIRRVTTGRDLLDQDVQHEVSAPVVFAAPDFDALPTNVAPTTNPTSSEVFAPLPGAEDEGRRLAMTWPAAVSRRGADAAEETLSRLNRPDWLHLATHGFSDLGELLPESAPERLRRLAASADPLSRAGLALAGANLADQWSESGRGDGIVTAAELGQMDLRGTRLVVLSACNTGRGDDRAADGLFGLRRALKFAGAEASLVSVYVVDDSTARLVAEQVVAGLRAEGDAARSLSEAQRYLRRRPETAHPLFWSGWSLTGGG